MALGVKIREKDGQSPPTRFFSTKQEQQIATTTGGQATPNSGATMWQKGDVLTQKFLLEAKTKVKPSESITLKKEWFQKNKEEALFMGKPYSALVFNFGPDQENYYVIDEYSFLEFLNYLNNKQE
jgi:hypothetical protein